MVLVSVMLFLIVALNTVSVKSSLTRKELLRHKCVEVPCYLLKSCRGKCATFCIFTPVNEKCKFKGSINKDRCIRYDETCKTPSLPPIPCRPTKQLSCTVDIDFLS